MIKTKLQPKILSASDSGFTIIEVLVGVVFIAILLAAISPVLVMSTAVRVQSKGMEKAVQAAETFINDVSNNSISAPTKVITETPNTPINLETEMPVPEKTDTDLYFFKKDSTITACNPISTCQPYKDTPFDEFYIQAAQIKPAGTKTSDGYRLAMRIYREDLDFDQTILPSSTGGIVVNKQAPILIKTVEISGSTTFGSLCSRLGCVQ
ncbi:prepilin-type N-terminal cleavage/methylation domain-containing protein [Dolichospermum circinale]|uniref:prepilin-type N-terminal cleavage/methylation domain-containing protein n=1 Tax=Dolichospermum circinale TaxID=109265 RepID=UPI0003FC906F|nr:prepilin-type N-terminal cleavage/methylation domain-containing protein [Dolichospermum circinale]MDB9473756.1 prepilin-type N-terminal cleavage/methylation domain-containing protein [Dolichospermum circinale CS-537/11]MDB9479241.1 prepilin-type N-terminal cleavage/methylation domain-containing protein [Dolichospermum circinale CS-537/03]